MRICKKIDIHLIKSSLSPFIAAFFIAIFVLIMQFLWSFIDDIIGKGIGTFVILELLFYRSLSLFPLALPIGVLLSSVMVFGNMSERYELSSWKSAGVSLIRVIRPAFIFALLVAMFSIFCSNTLIPLSTLKFQSRLYDIRNQKPALSLEEGVFNHDFKGFTIRIGEKDPDNIGIYDILIYDQTTSTRRRFNMISADHGEMYVAADGRTFVMKLYDGHQYQEIDKTSNSQDYPFARSEFREWTKYFDLSEFELVQTDEEMFKSHHSMKSVRQLMQEVDTIDDHYRRTQLKALYDFTDIFTLKKRLDPEVQPPDSTTSDSIGRFMPGNARLDDNKNRFPTAPVKQAGAGPVHNVQKISDRRLRKTSAPILALLDTLPADANWSTILAAMPEVTQRQLHSQAASKARGVKDSNNRLTSSLNVIDERRVEHIYELHFKFSLAAVCIIFLFIGAPMGAIVRKGGYGYPLLVAIVFFTVFIILTLLFDKLSESRALAPALAAWAPCLVMMPISAALSYKAMTDTKIVDVGRIFAPVRKLFHRFAQPQGS